MVLVWLNLIYIAMFIGVCVSYTAWRDLSYRAHLRKLRSGWYKSPLCRPRKPGPIIG